MGEVQGDGQHPVAEVDQRDVQKRSITCHDYPGSYVVADILKKFNIKRVLDVTYGRGRFYKAYRPELLIGSDPVKWGWLVYPDKFYQLTVFQLNMKLRSREIEIPKIIACVVVDPPKWSANGRYNKRDEYNFIIGSPKLIIEYAKLVAQQIMAKYLLVHYREVLNLGKIVYVVRYMWLARYAYTKDKNISYFALYGVV
jgi:hypothetical protein